mgnify:CR=1 FL=1
MDELLLTTPFEVSVKEFKKLRDRYIEPCIFTEHDLNDSVSYHLYVRGKVIAEDIKVGSKCFINRIDVLSEEKIINYINALKDYYHILDIGKIDCQNIDEYFNKAFSAVSQYSPIAYTGTYGGYLIDKETQLRCKIRMMEKKYYQITAHYAVEVSTEEQVKLPEMKETYKEQHAVFLEKFHDTMKKQRVKMVLKMM